MYDSAPRYVRSSVAASTDILQLEDGRFRRRIDDFVPQNVLRVRHRPAGGPGNKFNPHGGPKGELKVEIPLIRAVPVA